MSDVRKINTHRQEGPQIPSRNIISHQVGDAGTLGGSAGALDQPGAALQRPGCLQATARTFARRGSARDLMSLCVWAGQRGGEGGAFGIEGLPGGFGNKTVI